MNMRTTRFRIYRATLVFLLFAAAASAQEDPEIILKRVQKNYDAMKDFSCSFRQVVRFGVTRNEQEFSGKLWMKKTNKYRIEMEDQTIVTDGSTVWSFTGTTNQVLIDAFRDDPRALTPDKILVNVSGKYTVSALPAEKGDNREISVLKLVPREKMAGLTWMKVWVDDETSLMHKVQLMDVSGNLTTYILEKIMIDSHIADSTFSFTAPAGAEVVDLR